MKKKYLGCWCAPWKCHGDVLIKLYNEFYNPTISKTPDKEKKSSKKPLDDADTNDVENEGVCAKKMKKD